MGSYPFGFYEQRSKQNSENQIQNEVVSNQNNKSNEKFNIVNYIKNDLLDFALIIGMSPDQYWYENPQLLYNYKRAYEFTQKKIEQQLWLLARYNQCAFSSAVVNVVGITDYKKYKVPDMPKCPYSEEENKTLTARQVENERLRAYAFFKNIKINK